MDPEQQSQSANQPQQPSNGSKAIWIVLVLIILVAILAVVGWYWWQNVQLKKAEKQAKTTTQQSEQQQKVKEPTPSPAPSTSTATPKRSEAFETAVNTKDKKTAQSLFANPINLVLQSTECCGEVTPEEAGKNLSYIDNVASFNFSQDQDIVKQIKQKNTSFQDQIVGVASNNKYILSYHVDANGKIDRLYMSVSYELILE